MIPDIYLEATVIIIFACLFAIAGLLLSQAAKED